LTTKVEQRLGSPSAAADVRGAGSLSFWPLLAHLAPFVLALAAYTAVFLVMRPDTTGDEPHYLLVAESIAFDGDVDLANDYANRERTLRVVNTFPLDPDRHAADYDGSGQLRPLHGVGLSAVLAPAVGLGGLTGAQLTMVLIAALLADQLFRLLRDLRFRRRYRIGAWLAVAGCFPLLVFASQIYPEVPAALLIVVALRVMVGRAASPVALALGATAGAALVWLHVRYLPLAMGVFAGLILAACAQRRSGAAPTGIRATVASYVATARREWRGTVLPVVVPFALVLGTFAAAFQHWYGTPNPTAPYRFYSTTNAGDAGWNFLYDYALADVLSPVHGWIPFVPVHWLGLAAVGCLLIRFGWPAAACLAVPLGYELILASAAPNVGWGLPARYLIPFIPLIAIPIAVLLQHVRASRILFVPLLAGSLVIAVAAARDHHGLYPIDDSSRIYGVRSMAHLFPIPLPPYPPSSFVLQPGQYPPQSGRVEDGMVIAREGRDEPGFVMWGPYSTLKEGAYKATFPLAVEGVPPDAHVATIEIAGAPPGGKVLEEKVVVAGELKGRSPTAIPLDFSMPGGYLIETRVFYHGRGTFRVGPVKVQAHALAPGRPYPSWALAVAWVVGTVLFGWWFVRRYRREAISSSA
jgi:hypothetical protein